MAQSIYTRPKIDGDWAFVRVEEGPGRKTGDLEPPFYIRPFIDGKQRWHRLAAETFKDAKIEAAEAQSEATPENRTSIEASADEFIADSTKSKKESSIKAYRLHLKQFLESLNGQIKYMDEITEKTISGYRDWMQTEGYCAKTQNNRIMTVLSFLKKNKIKTEFSIANDLPDVEDEPAVPFESDVLKKLFDAMTPEEFVRYKFFLGTACRDKEVSFAAWNDIDFAKSLFHVRRKPDVGFTPKSHQSRTIRIPSELVTLLKERRKKNPSARWIFVNEDGKPDNHFLRKFKRIALRAEVNCGHCKTTITKGKYRTRKASEVSCKTDPVCEHIYLHRLRKTCASNWELAGVPIRTIQYMLGHKSLETTMIYLGVANLDKLGGAIDAASSAAVGD